MRTQYTDNWVSESSQKRQCFFYFWQGLQDAKVCSARRPWNVQTTAVFNAEKLCVLATISQHNDGSLLSRRFDQFWPVLAAAHTFFSKKKKKSTEPVLTSTPSVTNVKMYFVPDFMGKLKNSNQKLLLILFTWFKLKKKFVLV
jgi:hypothetical protein